MPYRERRCLTMRRSLHTQITQYVLWRLQFNSSPPYAAYMRQWIGSALAQLMAPTYHLIHCRVIVNWTLRNTFQWNLNQNSKLFIHTNASEMRTLCSGRGESNNVLKCLHTISLRLVWCGNIFEFSLSMCFCLDEFVVKQSRWILENSNTNKL